MSGLQQLRKTGFRILRIQNKTIAYSPSIYRIIYDIKPHPTEYDESDDLEYQKRLPSKPYRSVWDTRILGSPPPSIDLE